MTALILLQLLATFSCVLAVRWLLATRTRLAAEASAGKDELLAAKDRALDAQARELAALRELTPLRIREFLAASRAELGGCCAALDAGHRAARKEIERCNAEITRLQDQGDWHAEAIGPLAARRDELLALARAMRPGLRELQHESEFPESFSLRLPRIHPETVTGLAQAYQDLAARLPLDDAGAVRVRCERVVQAYRHRLDEATLFSEGLNAAPAGPVWERPENGE
jgi:hypothetical protein